MKRLLKRYLAMLMIITLTITTRYEVVYVSGDENVAEGESASERILLQADEDWLVYKYIDEIGESSFDVNYTGKTGEQLEEEGSSLYAYIFVKEMDSMPYKFIGAAKSDSKKDIEEMIENYNRENVFIMFSVQDENGIEIANSDLFSYYECNLHRTYWKIGNYEHALGFFYEGYNKFDVEVKYNGQLQGDIVASISSDNEEVNEFLKENPIENLSYENYSEETYTGEVMEYSVVKFSINIADQVLGSGQGNEEVKYVVDFSNIKSIVGEEVESFVFIVFTPSVYDPNYEEPTTEYEEPTTSKVESSADEAEDFITYGYNVNTYIGDEIELTPTVYDYTINTYANTSDNNFSFKWYIISDNVKSETLFKSLNYTLEVTEDNFCNNLNDYIQYVCEVYYKNELVGEAWFSLYDQDNIYYVGSADTDLNTVLGEEKILEISIRDSNYQLVDLDSGEFSFEWYKGESAKGDYDEYEEERDGKLLGTGKNYTIDSVALEDCYSYINGYKQYYCKVFKENLFIDCVSFWLTCDELTNYEFSISSEDYEICVKEGEKAIFTPTIKDYNYNDVELSDSRLYYKWYKVDMNGNKGELLSTSSVYEIASTEIIDYTSNGGYYLCQVYVDGYCVGETKFTLSYDSGYSTSSRNYRAQEGQTLTLKPSVVDEETWEEINGFDDTFSFEWFRENSSECIGKDSSYLISSLTEEDFSSDSEYYCKVYYNGLYIGNSYVYIKYDYTVTSDVYYREVGDSVTLEPKIYKGDYTYDEDYNIVGELADLDDSNFSFEWIKRSEDGDNEGLEAILCTESSYTIESLTEGDMNEDWEGYYFRCKVYYKGSQIGTANIDIVSPYQIGSDDMGKVYVPDGGSTTLTPYVYDRVNECMADLSDSKFTIKWYKRSGKKQVGKDYTREFISDNVNLELSNLTYEDSYDCKDDVAYYCEVYIDGHLRGTEYKYIRIEEYQYSCDTGEIFVANGDNVKLKPRVKDYKDNYVEELPALLTCEWYKPTTSEEDGYDYGDVISTSQVLEIDNVQKSDWYVCKLFYNGKEVDESDYYINESTLLSVTEVEDLQSEHPLSKEEVLSWEYTLNGAENLKIEFSDETDCWVYISDDNDVAIGYSSYNIANYPIYVKGDTVKISIFSNDYGEDYGFSVDSISAISTEQMKEELAERNESIEDATIEDTTTAEQMTTKAPTTEPPTTKVPSSEQMATKVPTTEQSTTKVPSSVPMATKAPIAERSTTKVSSSEESTKKEQITTVKKKSVKVPKKTKINKIVKAKKALKVTWKKVKGVKGYHVAVYTSKKNANKNKKAIFKTHVKKAKFVVKSKKLKNKQKLFVRVRAYVLDSNGKKVYGKWSKIKKVTIKK